MLAHVVRFLCRDERDEFDESGEFVASSGRCRLRETTNAHPPSARTAQAAKTHHCARDDSAKIRDLAPASNRFVP